MAENFDFIENDVRPTRRKKMEKAKGQRKSVNKKKGNRRMSRRSRRATSKAKILYLQKKNNYNKNGATDNNGKTTLFEDESDRIEIYNVVLRTLWWAKNFRERFIGIDDPSRGRYKWQHNAPPGQEDMNIYIALKDVFLQCHDTASVLRKKEDNVLQSRKQWLQAVNKFLDALKYGFVVDGTFKHISDPHLCFENRQNLPKLFKPTGGFYIFKAGWYRKNKSLATNATKAYEIPNNLSLDIDSLDDFAKFELILKGKGL